MVFLLWSLVVRTGGQEQVVCNWRHKHPASVGNNLGVITKLHLLTNAFTRRRVRKRKWWPSVTETATLVVAWLQCVNNCHLLKGFANDCLCVDSCEYMVCSEWIIVEYRQDMCNDIQFASKMIHSNLSTGCPRRNVPNFGRVFLMLKYTDITQNTYVQIWTVTGQRSLKLWQLLHTYWLPNTY